MKSEFSASLLQSSVSHDPSEIIIICWFAAQQTFLVIINVGSIRAHISFGNCVIWWIECSMYSIFEYSGVVVPGEVGILLIYTPNFF